MSNQYVSNVMLRLRMWSSEFPIWNWAVWFMLEKWCFAFCPPPPSPMPLVAPVTSATLPWNLLPSVRYLTDDIPVVRCLHAKQQTRKRLVWSKSRPGKVTHHAFIGSLWQPGHGLPSDFVLSLVQTKSGSARRERERFYVVTIKLTLIKAS